MHVPNICMRAYGRVLCTHMMEVYVPNHASLRLWVTFCVHVRLYVLVHPSMHVGTCLCVRVCVGASAGASMGMPWHARVGGCLLAG